MAIAKKLTIEDIKIKVMVWGEPGSGKSRFALSAPSPLVIDLENSTPLYFNQFDFLHAEVNQAVKETKNATKLTKSIIDEIINGVYPDVKTIIIDPITDLLDNLETLLSNNYEKIINRKLTDLNQLEKTKWYCYRRDKTREMLDMILNLPLNVVFVARAKNMWDRKDGKMQPVGKTFDGLDIIEYLPDVVLHMETGGKTHVKKSRIGNMQTEFDNITWKDIEEALEGKRFTKVAKLNKVV